MTPPFPSFHATNCAADAAELAGADAGDGEDPVFLNKDRDNYLFHEYLPFKR